MRHERLGLGMIDGRYGERLDRCAWYSEGWEFWGGKRRGVGGVITEAERQKRGDS